MHKYVWIITISQLAILAFFGINPLNNQDRITLKESVTPSINENSIQPCNQDPKTILFIAENEAEAIKNIRSYYAHIEKNKETYKVYQLFTNDNNEPFLIDEDDERIEEEAGQFIIEYDNNYLSTYGRSLYYFNEEEALVYIEESSWDNIAISGGGETLNKYYFKPGSIHPFFIYAYEHTYSTFFGDDVSNTEKFQEHRIYVEQESAVSGQCPKIIRALVKNHEVQQTIKLEDYTGNFDSGPYIKEFNKQPNKKMTASALFSTAKLLLFDNEIISFAKAKKIPLASH